MKVRGKTALITGAGTGIGRATALLLAREGAQIVVTDVNEQTGGETAALIQRQGGEAIFMKHDVTHEPDWAAVSMKAADTFGTVNILFNNAGIFKISALIDTTVEDWDLMMAINVKGPFLGMKHVIPLMKQNGGGSIINASSNAGLFGAAGISAYGASKGAVRILTKNAAMEYAEFNIRVNSIHPGYIKTQMIEYAAKVANKTPDDQAGLVPLKRLGSTSDVSNLVLFLASDDSAYATGAEFVVDGGVSAGQSVWAKD